MSQERKLPERENGKRTVHLHFEETCQYSVPIITDLNDEALEEFYNSDEWFALVEEVDDWHTKCCTAVVNRELEAIYDDDGRGI